jgi:hypothetical protein
MGFFGISGPTRDAAIQRVSSSGGVHKGVGIVIELHERLSEFSYGYGATRETEKLLASVGVRAVPFLPSLRHEDELGFDVAFDRPGVPLLLQFKLGQSLKRFVRTDLSVPAPAISRPFWRYKINTAEN